MPILFDPRGNEFQGSVDQVGNQTVNDIRDSDALLGALNAEILMDLNGKSAAVFDLRTGAANLTLVFEATIDGTNYFGLPAINLLTEQMLAAVIITSTQATEFLINCTGFRRIRCRVSAFTSGNVTVSIRASQALALLYARPIPTTLIQTGTAAVNVGVTVTLPAAGAGLFHYITKIEVNKYYSAVGVSAAAPVLITTTNLPAVTFTTEQQAAAQGQCPKVVDSNFKNPLKSSAANTATTIVCPAQLQTIWRVTVYYYVGA